MSAKSPSEQIPNAVFHFKVLEIDFSIFHQTSFSKGHSFSLKDSILNIFISSLEHLFFALEVI